MRAKLDLRNIKIIKNTFAELKTTLNNKLALKITFKDCYT